MKFTVTYIDPETQEKVTDEVEFEASRNPDISAREWAEDYAYGRADKGWYEVKEVKP